MLAPGHFLLVFFRQNHLRYEIIHANSTCMNVEYIQDPGLLRQYAKQLELEVSRLYQRITELTEELAKAQGKDATKAIQLELQHIKEQLEARNKALFGPSSEKMNRKKEKKSKKPKTGHGPTPQPELPIVEVTHDLDEADKVCTECGGELGPFEGQDETSEEIAVIERKYVVRRHIQQKYRCTCGACIETALGPDKLIKGGRYSIDFAVQVVIDKYLDHLPLDRQVRIMKRQGLVATKQALWDQLWAMAKHLEPTYEALLPYILEAPVIGADETKWRLMNKPGSTTWWAWSFTSPDGVYYTFQASRSSKTPTDVLGFYEGIVVVDGYSSYGAARNTIASIRDGPVFTIANCWAHARRKFKEAESSCPDEAEEIITLIGKLYENEHRVDHLKGQERLDMLARIRREDSKPIIETIKKWLVAQSTEHLPKSAMGKAISYTANLWKGLTLFLENSMIWIDNNHTERGIRGIALGRKNHLGSKSERGIWATSLFYSLIESAKLVGVDPAAYLAEATIRAIKEPGAITLPHDYAKELEQD